MKDNETLDEMQNEINDDERKFLNNLVISNGIHLNDIIIDFEYEHDPLCKKFNYFGMDLEKETILENTNPNLENESEIIDLTCKRYLLNLYFRENFVFIYIGLLDRFTILFHTFDGKKSITEISEEPLIEKGLRSMNLYKLSEEIFSYFSKFYDALVSKSSHVPGFLPHKVCLAIDSECKIIHLKVHLLTHEEIRLLHDGKNTLNFFSHEFRAGFVNEKSMRSSIVKLITLLHIGNPLDEEETIELNLPNFIQTLRDFEINGTKNKPEKNY